MNNIDALINVILLGLLLFKQDVLHSVLTIECYWIILQFIWITCRPRTIQYDLYYV